MSFKAHLQIEGKSFEISGFSLEVSQTTDSTGRPSSATQGGKIDLKMESVADEVFLDWMVSPHKTLNGKIILYKTDEDAKLKEISFEQGHCIELSEKFDGSHSGTGMMMHLTISAENIKIGETELKNNWLK